MSKLKKLIFKQIIFLLSIFVKPFKNYWLISLSHGGGSFEAENCKKFFFEEVLNILSKNYKVNFNLFDIGKKILSK